MKAHFLCVLTALVGPSALSATIELNDGNLVTSGWKKTASAVYQVGTNASVSQTADAGANNYRFFAGPMNTAWQFQWAGISTNEFAGMPLAIITSLTIRNYGIAGDSPNWQPPTFTFILDKGDTNQRCVTWRPWNATTGNPRQPGGWNQYDAATTGSWYVEETAVYYSSLAALKATMPNAYFEYTSELPLEWGYASQQAFNVGLCPTYDQDRPWFTNTSGYVDWFEVGVNSNITRYDLGVVPEPGALFVIVGVIGVASLRKRARRSSTTRRLSAIGERKLEASLRCRPRGVDAPSSASLGGEPD